MGICHTKGVTFKKSAARYRPIPVLVQPSTSRSSDTESPKSPVVAPGWAVTTLSGNSTPGLEDGEPEVAKFDLPSDLALLPDGSIVVADGYNNSIRRVDPISGVVVTLAGDSGGGASGYRNGPGPQARFCVPSGIAVDGQGRVYVADRDNHCVRRLSTDGQEGHFVITLAGTGKQGLKNGPGTVAEFSFPIGIAVDKKYNVYVADSGNHCIRLISADGTVSTFAGGAAAGHCDGPANSAFFAGPQGVCVDELGQVMVADTWNHCIRMIVDGKVTTIAGTGEMGMANGPADSAQFDRPKGIATGIKGALYVVEASHHAVRRINSDGQVATLAGHNTGGYVDGFGKDARFQGPTGVAGEADGSVLVADFFNNCIRRIFRHGEKRRRLLEVLCEGSVRGRKLLQIMFEGRTRSSIAVSSGVTNTNTTTSSTDTGTPGHESLLLPELLIIISDYIY